MSGSKQPEPTDATARLLAPTAPHVVVHLRVAGPPQEVSCSEPLRRNASVVINAGRGLQRATVLGPGTGQHVVGSVVRRANAHDAAVVQRHEVRERQAWDDCKRRIAALGLPMKLAAVEIAHDGLQAVFHFTSAERVDFRTLVKDLARHMQMRIELRQIGVRDAARHTGGQGVCGRKLCCSTWLPEFSPISLRMAKDQNLPLNQDKLAGLCGRLRCCLQYEQSQYEAQRQTLPKVGKRVQTPAGIGRVRDLNILRGIVRVDLESGGFAEFKADLCKIL